MSEGSNNFFIFTYVTSYQYLLLFDNQFLFTDLIRNLEHRVFSVHLKIMHLMEMDLIVCFLCFP